MATTRILILGHSFIHHLKSFLIANYSPAFLNNFQLGHDPDIRWHEIGGRTVARTIKYDLGVVESLPCGRDSVYIYCCVTLTLIQLNLPHPWPNSSKTVV